MNTDPLQLAELQYKFSLAVTTLSATEGPLSGRLQTFTWGNGRLEGSELELTQSQEQLAASLLEHTATYIMMQQLDKELSHKHGERRFASTSGELRPAAWIARLLRNAFAHDPLCPVWQIDRRVRDTSLVFEEVIALNTTGLNGQVVRARTYGGPIAVLRLLQACRQRFL